MNEDQKALKNAWKQAERKKLADSIPLPRADLKALFNHLDSRNPEDCDHTMSETIAFLQSRGIDPEKIIPWLQDHGGYCDCEVILNVDDKFGKIVGRDR